MTDIPNLDLKKAKEETRAYLIEHVELTKSWADAHERYLQLLRSDVEMLINSRTKNIDVFLGLIKNLVSVAFTGFIALEVANPAWVNPNSSISPMLLLFLAGGGIIILFLLMLYRNSTVSFLTETISDRIKAIKALLDAESSCIQDMHKIHGDLFPISEQESGSKNNDKKI